MAKDEALELPGTVTELLPDSTFRVKLDNDHELVAEAGGRLRKSGARVNAGDKVLVEMAPSDFGRGRITHRFR
jgi:translation initiation factor IF-1